MPFVDLSSPAQQNNNVTDPNQSIASATPVSSVSNNQNTVEPAVSSIPPVIPQINSSIASVQNNVPQQLPSDTAVKQPVSEEHELMRDLPQTVKQPPAPSVNFSGIKEFKGPPIGGAAPATIPPAVVGTSVPNTTVGGQQPATQGNPIKTEPAVPTTSNVIPAIPVVGDINTAPVAASNPAPAMPAPPAPAVANIPAMNIAPAPVVKAQVISDNEIKMGKTVKIADLLTLAEKRNASDLHLAVGYAPILRVDGQLLNVGTGLVTDQMMKDICTELLSAKELKMLEDDRDIDFSHSHTTGTRFRVNIFYNKGSLAGAFRLIPSRIRSIAELNLPEIFYELINIPQGLIILAGPTGSGKSTTIASMIQEINMTTAKHIVTIEDPIEYLFPKGKSLINQREVGSDVTNFKRGLREVLREDPNVVVVGEMRDFETIAMTITTAETGHLVFATLHTNSASQTIDRMIDVFPDAQQAQIRAQLANVIAAVISQRLIPVKGGGRKAVTEIMIATPAIRNAIREAKTYQIDNMIQTSAELGMITLEKSLVDLIRSGDLTLEQAQAFTTKPEELISLMRSN